MSRIRWQTNLHCCRQHHSYQSCSVPSIVASNLLGRKMFLYSENDCSFEFHLITSNKIRGNFEEFLVIVSLTQKILENHQVIVFNYHSTFQFISTYKKDHPCHLNIFVQLVFKVYLLENNNFHLSFLYKDVKLFLILFKYPAHRRFNQQLAFSIKLYVILRNHFFLINLDKFLDFIRNHFDKEFLQIKTRVVSQAFSKDLRSQVSLKLIRILLQVSSSHGKRE